MPYPWQPIDTKKIKLPAEIVALSEVVATNCHEVCVGSWLRGKESSHLRSGMSVMKRVRGHAIINDDWVRNVQVWAKARISEGWAYGPKRDNYKLKHPLLVPYDQLSEVDKQNDRNSSWEVLKVGRLRSGIA